MSISSFTTGKNPFDKASSTALSPDTMIGRGMNATAPTNTTSDTLAHKRDEWQVFMMPS